MTATLGAHAASALHEHSDPTHIVPTRAPSPIDDLDADEVLKLLPGLPNWPTASGKPQTWLRGAELILAWLADFDTSGWQARWTAAAGDEMAWLNELVAANTRPGRGPVRVRDQLLSGLRALIFLRAIRPGYDFFYNYRPTLIYDLARQAVEAEAIDRCEEAGKRLGFSGSGLNDAIKTIVRMVLHTGGRVDDLQQSHFLAMREAYRRSGRHLPAGTTQAWEILRSMGVLTESQSLNAVIRRRGRGSTAELVDSYGVKCRAVRDVLVRYLDDKRPALDYNSFRNLVTVLVGLFWVDIERHHPGINTLQLPREAAEEWKKRLRTVVLRDGRVKLRRFYLTRLVTVRAFYLDIAEWALEDPSWAPWAVPCPIRRGETAGLGKEKRKVSAEMHQRIRERLPHLDAIIQAAYEYRRSSAELLKRASQTAIGETFDHAGLKYQRAPQYTTQRTPRHMREHAVIVQQIDTGEKHDATKGEDDAFWSWSIVETLRHTGIRVEELQELTQMAVVQYQLPDTGEVVPLLQIVPSKSGEERVLLIGPELADVLATIITRLQQRHHGTIPAVSRYDPYERVEGPPLPHLFQRFSRSQRRNTVIGTEEIYNLLELAVTHASVPDADADGEPLQFRPHDFRRMFATEAVTGGLPVHIAAKVLGHASLETTQHYLAVFPDEMIRSYRAYLDKRRSIRPEAEYREPTQQEWTEFQQHFHERRLELGSCGRPYGTPCQHEHACVRCPMLRMDPRQRARLAEIIGNLEDRIKEARLNGWLGEARGLQTSRDAAVKKLVSLDRTLAHTGEVPKTGPADLGMPTVTSAR